MRRALVTGGSGYFGSLLIEKLLINGYTVGCLDINEPENSLLRLNFIIVIFQI